MLDAFLYSASEMVEVEPASANETASQTKKSEMQMASHYDPGVLTLTRASECPGIEIYDYVRQAWVAVEV